VSDNPRALLNAGWRRTPWAYHHQVRPAVLLVHEAGQPHGVHRPRRAGCDGARPGAVVRGAAARKALLVRHISLSPPVVPHLLETDTVPFLRTAAGRPHPSFWHLPRTRGGRLLRCPHARAQLERPSIQTVFLGVRRLALNHLI
jgi:hypothetical protein